MSDIKNQEGQTENQGGNVDENKNISIEEKIKEATQKIEFELEKRFKNEIAGLNRKNSELQESIKKKELEGKTEEEQKNLLLEEKKRIENEIAELNRGRLIDKELHSAGLPLEFAKRIVGNDENEIKSDVTGFNEFINKLAQEKADKIINERLAGKAPEGGKTPEKPNIDDMIKQAQDKGDFVRVMALKEQKRKLKT